MEKRRGAPRGRGEPKPPKPVQPELRLFGRLIAEFEADGRGAPELSEITGIEYSHLKKLCDPEKAGYTGLSMEIVRKVRNTLHISADYFLQDLDSAMPAKLYSLDKKRQEAWTSRVDEQMHATSQAIHELRAEMAELRRDLHQARAENDQLKHTNDLLRDKIKTRR